MAAVKSKRAEKARETRRRMLDAARELFIADGYGATTLKGVAERAGVAVQTIYFTFGNKRALLKELVDVTVAGDDEPVATMDRPWFRDVLAQDTAEAQLRAHVAGTRKVLERVAPITQMLAAATAVDPEVAGLWPQEADPRHTVQTAAAEALTGKPGAREDVAAEEAADVLYGVLSPELYLLFVRDRGWTPERWEDWAYRTLRRELCQGSPRTP
ncbi:TetR/AcrR family transcriptional regulator [Streptomyces coryli]|uniref:TetR/AcrR family transcriptional regulator n=1 Tax=Streptomyces coryli TaxID=1128680 RepID=UPI0019D1AAAA|nr:TetR/AcrR family transcriptional regulator [Streptomyces coryli]